MSAYLHDGKPVGTFELYLQEVAELKKLDSELSLFGSHTHHYGFNPVAKQSEIDQFEALHGVKLPEILTEFYLTIGNGGAGPGYGILPLNRLLTLPAGDLMAHRFDNEDDGKWLVEMGLPKKIFAFIDHGFGCYYALEPNNNSGTVYSYDFMHDENCGEIEESFMEVLMNWIERSRQELSKKSQ